MSMLDKFRNKWDALRDRLDGRRQSRADARCAASKAEVDRARSEVTQAKIEIERMLHSEKPGARGEEFVPPFHLWIGFPEIQDLNIEQALDRYIDEYNLLRVESSEQPEAVARVAARLKILHLFREKCASDVASDLDHYIIAQECILQMRKGKSEMDLKKRDFDKDVLS